MPKTTQRAANGTTQNKSKATKRKPVARGWRKPTDEVSQRLIAEDRELVKFLSKGMPAFSAATDQRDERRKDAERGK